MQYFIRTLCLCTCFCTCFIPLFAKPVLAVSFMLKGEMSLGFEQGWQPRNMLAPGLGMELSQPITSVISLGLDLEGNFTTSNTTSTVYNSNGTTSTSSGNGLLLFYGAIIRAGHLPQTHWFIDTQVGATPQASGTPFVPAIGIGIGYHRGTGSERVVLCPRIGFRILPLIQSGASSAIGSQTQALIDLGVLIWFNFFQNHSLIGWSGGGSSI